MSFSKELRRLTDLPLTSRPILVGQEIKVNLSNVESPRKIALQPLTNEPDLDLLADLLLDLPEIGPSVDCVSAGTIWGAVYSDDGVWYRGVVKRVDEKNKKAEICFIDYGNFDMVDIETGLRYLSDELLKFPPMVFESQWLHAPPNSDPYTELNDLIDADQPITVKIVETKLPPSEVSLMLGTVEDGPVVVIINELLHSKKSFNGRCLDPVPEADPSQSEEEEEEEEEEPEVRSDTSCGDIEDSVDYAVQVQEPTLADTTLEGEPSLGSDVTPAEPVRKKDASDTSTVVTEQAHCSAPLTTAPDSRTLEQTTPLLFGLGHTGVSPHVLEIQPSTQTGNGLSPEMGHFVELKLARFDADLDCLKLLTDDARKQAEKYFKTTETLLTMSNAQRIQWEDLIIKMNAMEAEIKDLKAKGDEGRATVIPGLSVSYSSDQPGLMEIVLSLGNMLKEKDELASQNTEAWAEERRQMMEKYNMLKEENIALRLHNAGL